MLRHSRVLPNAAGTVMAASTLLTMYAVPVSAFSGRLSVEKRGSRQVPVHAGSGSTLALECVSL